MRMARKVLVLSLGLFLLAPMLAAAKASVTLENLKKAYNSEINSQAKYTAYAAKAKAEGYVKAAKLFRVLAKSEGMQAAGFAKVLKAMGHKPASRLAKIKAGATKDNLHTAINTLTYETQATYPDYSKQAETDKNENAGKAFAATRSVETKHNQLLVTAAANLEDWKADGDFFICKVCGNVTSALDFTNCPVCNAPASEFEKVK